MYLPPLHPPSVGTQTCMYFFTLWATEAPWLAHCFDSPCVTRVAACFPFRTVPLPPP